VSARWTKGGLFSAISNWAAMAKKEMKALRQTKSAMSIMYRMLAKSKMLELLTAYDTWHEAAKLHFQVERMQAKGSGVLKRTGQKLKMNMQLGAIASWKQRCRKEIVSDLRVMLSESRARENQLEVSLAQVAFKGGETIMKRVGMRIMNKDLVLSLIEWVDKVAEFRKERDATRKMRSVAARMLNKEVVFVLQEWRTRAQVWAIKARRTCLNVIQRLKNRDIARCVIIWADSWRTIKAQGRAQMLLRRVGMRMKFRAASDSLREWNLGWKAFKNFQWKDRAMKLEKDVEDLKQALDFLSHERNLNNRSIMTGIAKQRIKIKPWSQLDF